MSFDMRVHIFVLLIQLGCNICQHHKILILAADLVLHRIEHIFDKNAVALCGIVDHDVGDRTDELTVLNDGRAAQECAQVGITFFNKKFISQEFNENCLKKRCICAASFQYDIDKS